MDGANTLPLGLLEFLDFRRERPVADLRDEGVEAAILADRAGYRRLWVPEHHARGVPSTNPMSLLPVLGSLTHSIRIGPAVSLIRIREPHLLAEDLATAAHFCRDRLDVGLGRGDVRGPGTEVLDPIRRNEDALDQATLIVTELLDHGNAWIDPPIGGYQQWMHGAGFKSAQVAGDLGLNYCHAMFFNPDLNTCLETLQAHRQTHPLGVRAVALGVIANPDPEIARSEADLRGVVISRAGTPDECVEQILELLSYDLIDEVIITEQSATAQAHLAAISDIGRSLAAELWPIHVDVTAGARVG